MHSSILPCNTIFAHQREVASLILPAHRPIFLCSFLINDPSLFENLCRQAYYTASPLTLGQATSMYGVLYCLLKELVLLQSPLAQKHDLKVHIATCERNFSRGIETYQTLAMPCFENVLSLALGVGNQRHNVFIFQVVCSHQEPYLDIQSTGRGKTIPVLYTLGCRRQPLSHAGILPRDNLWKTSVSESRADSSCLLVYLHYRQEHVPSPRSPVISTRL